MNDPNTNSVQDKYTEESWNIFTQACNAAGITLGDPESHPAVELFNRYALAKQLLSMSLGESFKLDQYLKLLKIRALDERTLDGGILMGW